MPPRRAEPKSNHPDLFIERWTGLGNSPHSLSSHAAPTCGMAPLFFLST
jgi:hypothetical protein